MVKKRFPEKMDESRLDEVANELFRHTPARPTDRTVTKG